MNDDNQGVKIGDSHSAEKAVSFWEMRSVTRINEEKERGEGEKVEGNAGASSRETS